MPVASHEQYSNPQNQNGRDLGARPKRITKPPDFYGVHVPQPQRRTHSSSIQSGSRSARTRRTYGTKPSSYVSRQSRSSHVTNLSDLQASLLEEKEIEDELEELKRQRQEDNELDEKCRLIDQRAKTAQQIQEEAHRERETLVRQIALDRRIRIKEKELESVQLVSSFIKQNLSEDEQEDYEGAALPHKDVATSSFYDLPHPEYSLRVHQR